MAKAGRKQKPGKRTKSGRTSRAGLSRIIKGNAAAEANKATYGGYGMEALGRAYYKGLLGLRDDPRAKERYAKGVKLTDEWRKHFGERYRCGLDDSPRGGNDNEESEAQIARYHWMRREIERLDVAGFGSWFHQLCLARNTYTGPAWLQRIIDGEEMQGDRLILELNIKALDFIDERVGN